MMTISQMTFPEILKNLAYPLVFLIGGAGLPAESFTIFAGLVVLDTITGVMKTAVVHGGKSVTSSRLSIGVAAKGLIVCIPLVIAWSGRGAGFDATNLAQATLSVLILAEAYSVIGNIYSIRIKKDVQEFDAVAAMLGSLRSALEVMLKNQSNIKPPKN